MSPKDLGWAARLEGKGTSGNPYQRGTDEYRQWGNGWRGAEKIYDERKVITPMDLFLRRRVA